MFDLFSKLMRRKSSVVRRNQAGRKSIARAIQLEHLQPRELFAVDVSVSSQTLNIKGTSAADMVEVSWLKNGSSEFDDQIQVKEQGKVVATENVWLKVGSSYGLRFSSISFAGGAGNDSFKVTNNVLPHVKASSVDGVISVLASGDEGDDALSGANGNDGLYGGKGKDVLLGREGNDKMYGDDGADQLFGQAGIDSLWGGNGNDVLNGGSGDDNLFGELGDDSLYGEDGNDLIFGDFFLLDHPELDNQGGNDTIYGGNGNDGIVGGNGNDVIHGGWGSDEIHGDAYVGPGTPDASQLGVDLIYGDPLTMEPGAEVGNDKIFGGFLDDTIYGSFGNDELHGNQDNDYLVGGEGDDILYGDDGNDGLVGQNGNDTLYGGKGKDNLNGGAGDDTLDGGLDGSADVLIGGLGKDKMRAEWYFAGTKVQNRDQPSDFSTAQGDVLY